MPDFLIIILFIVWLVFANRKVFRRRSFGRAFWRNPRRDDHLSKGDYLSKLCKKQLLTPNEVEFYHRLTRALPDYYVFPQVAFNALLDVDGYVPAREFYFLRNRFEKKVADFVVCARPSCAVVAVVELDDKTHVDKKDEKRDALLKAAGYRIVRFLSRNKPSESEIAALFAAIHDNKVVTIVFNGPGTLRNSN